MLSFKQQYEANDISPRWHTGVDRRHVAVYVALALVVGFVLGFIVSRSMTRRENPSGGLNAASSPQAPARETPVASADAQPAEFRRVTHILRADTIEVEGVGLVRMIGVESPDGKPPREVYAVHGQNALSFVERTLLNQDVSLEFDPENATRGNKNESGETLAYVYTRDGTLVNGEMLKQGLAFVRPTEQFRLSNEFRNFERDAMREMRGVWGSSSSAPPLASAPSASQQTPPNSNASDEGRRRLSPMPPSALGPNVPAISGTSSASPSEPSVYVSQEDRLYHKAGCEFLGKKKQSIPLAVAKTQGYTACSRCYASTVLKAP
ncbi:MAG TPA: thermonuclease family protein [Blastocatellia bacterium]|jgi:endonuclease YncB( thermonuclease family)|nr:thermonuclease family protein [Blastocatellia bacterium]